LQNKTIENQLFNQETHTQTGLHFPVFKGNEVNTHLSARISVNDTKQMYVK